MSSMKDRDLELMSIDKEKDKENAQKALMNILSMERRLPEDFDAKKELQEARESRV